MSNLATEKTKRNRLLSAAILVKINFCNRFIIFGFTFSFFRFLRLPVLEYWKSVLSKKTTGFVNFSSGRALDVSDQK